MNRSLLIADDEESILSLLTELLSGPGITLRTAKSGSEAIEILDGEEIDVVLTDFMMPGVDGLAVLAHAKQILPGCEVVLMTGFGSVENAVQAMKLGAFHYITKPLNVIEVRNLVDRALELTAIKKENLLLKSRAIGQFKFENIIGISEPIRQVLSLVAKVADTDSTVLVLGESGTGKELIARAVHYNSKRAERMLVAINCSAIPADLLESELFGHVRGAFTGAHVERTGRFKMANRGTLFLDEIAEMSPALQAKLLRVLQEQSFIPVGGTKTIDVDVRVIAATNRNLEKEIAAGRFREDLYFRLNVIPIRIPPLRERPEDIPVLADHFLRKLAARTGRNVSGFHPAAMELLLRYQWPGNVRELENLVERLVVLKGEAGWFGKNDLPTAIVRDASRRNEPAAVMGSDGIDFRKATEEFENNLIRQALALSRGNRNRAAALLGLRRTTLVEMIKRKDLAPGDPSEN